MEKRHSRGGLLYRALKDAALVSPPQPESPTHFNYFMPGRFPRYAGYVTLEGEGHKEEEWRVLRKLCIPSRLNSRAGYTFA